MDLKQENKELRKLLWLRHGCTSLYGDDGEMQCNSCMIDFKRDSIKSIAHRMAQRQSNVLEGLVKQQEFFELVDKMLDDMVANQPSRLTAKS